MIWEISNKIKITFMAIILCKECVDLVSTEVVIRTAEILKRAS